MKDWNMDQVLRGACLGPVALVGIAGLPQSNLPGTPGFKGHVETNNHSWEGIQTERTKEAEAIVISAPS